MGELRPCAHDGMPALVMSRGMPAIQPAASLCRRMSASLSLLAAARDQVNIFTPDQLSQSWLAHLLQGLKRQCSEITMERLSYAFVVFNGGGRYCC